MKHYIIIGASAAGLATVGKLSKLISPKDRITCISSHRFDPYNTCLLADKLASENTLSDLSLVNTRCFEKENISLLKNMKVIDINPSTKTITLHSGAHMNYDALCIATGTTAYTLPQFKEKRPSNLFTFHTLNDQISLSSYIIKNKPKTALIVGAGLSGIECADALMKRGINVTIVEQHTTLLPHLINQEASTFLEKKIKELSQSIYLSTRLEHCNIINDVITTCKLSNGIHLNPDMVITTIGSYQNLELAHKAGIITDQSGIITNPFLETNIPGIFAAGDVIGITDKLTEKRIRSCTWPDAVQQGIIAGTNMIEKKKVYNALPLLLSSHFFNTEFVSCGIINSTPSSSTHEVSSLEHYHLFTIENNHLKGFLMIGKIDNIGTLRRLISTQEALSSSFFSMIS